MKKLFVGSHEHHSRHCHCGFERALENLRTKTGKRLGALGAAFTVLHLLFHVVECIVVPAILVGINQRIGVEDAVATSQTQTASVDNQVLEYYNDKSSILGWSFADVNHYLDLSYEF